MRTNGVHFLGARVLQLLRGQTERAARISHVVDKNRNAIGHVAHQHHRAHLIGSHTLLVNERKVHVQAIRNRGDPNESILNTSHFRGGMKRVECLPLGTTGIWRHNDRIFPIRYIVHNPFDNRRLGKQIIYRYIKETLFVVVVVIINVYSKILFTKETQKSSIDKPEFVRHANPL